MPDHRLLGVSVTSVSSEVLPIARIFFLLRVLWASPYSLLGVLIGGIGLCFGGHVRIRGREIEFDGGVTKWFVRRLPHGQFTLAFTLGHALLGQTDSSLDVLCNHEAVHVTQFERWGPFMLPACFFCSTYMWGTGCWFYRDNPFEREAKRRRWWQRRRLDVRRAAGHRVYPKVIRVRCPVGTVRWIGLFHPRRIRRWRHRVERLAWPHENAWA